jgi:hypothetical protein
MLDLERRNSDAERGVVSGEANGSPDARRTRPLLDTRKLAAAAVSGAACFAASAAAAPDAYAGQNPYCGRVAWTYYVSSHHDPCYGPYLAHKLSANSATANHIAPCVQFYASNGYYYTGCNKQNYSVVMTIQPWRYKRAACFPYGSPYLSSAYMSCDSYWGGTFG